MVAMHEEVPALGLFSRSGRFQRHDRQCRRGRRPMNMLPSDNVYLPTALGANEQYAALHIRVAAVRMEEPGELEVPLVVPGDEPGGQKPRALCVRG